MYCCWPLGLPSCNFCKADLSEADLWDDGNCMGSFQVYIDGTVERTPDAMHRVAEAIASKLGTSSQDLVVRMTKGRTMVKSNLDRAAAEALARSLEQLGARTFIDTGGGQTPRSGTEKVQMQSGLSAAFSGGEA